MSLRKRNFAKSTTITFRCPPDLEAYVKATSGSENGQSEVIRDAIQLDRELSQRLKKEQLRLQAFAEGQGLTLEENLAEILALLVRIALDALEVPPR